MKRIVLSFEWHCYPIWIYEEDGNIYNDLPDEWENKKDFDALLKKTQKLYDSAFIDTPHVFDFIGFQHKDDMEKMQSLLSQIRDFVRKNLPKDYIFEDRIEPYDELEGFEYKEAKK